MRTADPGKVSVCVKLEAFNSPTAALEIVVFGGGARGGGGGAQSVCSIEERRGGGGGEDSYRFDRFGAGGT